MNGAAAKRAARARLAARRDAIAPDTRRAADARILEQLLSEPGVASAGMAFVYVSMPAEADTRQLIDALHERGTRVLIPRILSRTRMIAGDFHGWDTLRPGPLGIPAPVRTDAFEGPVDIAIVPGLGFSSRGERLGYGAGYYDRWLADHPETQRIAIAYDCQIDDGISGEPHDIGMDCIITEVRQWRFPRPGERSQE